MLHWHNVWCGRMISLAPGAVRIAAARVGMSMVTVARWDRIRCGRTSVVSCPKCHTHTPPTCEASCAECKASCAKCEASCAIIESGTAEDACDQSYIRALPYLGRQTSGAKQADSLTRSCGRLFQEAMHAQCGCVWIPHTTIPRFGQGSAP